MGRGPVQILVVGFSDDSFAEHVLPELLRLRERDVVRVIDLTFVTKDEAGNLTRMDVAAMTASKSERFGALVAALIGFGPLGAEGISVGAGAGVGGACAGAQASETWAISDAIPPGASAAVVLVEHRWAIPLRAAVRRAGGFALEDTWVFPADLAAVGAAGAATGWRWDGDPDS
ncbi:MAG TPA: hypothetical protein VI011_03090 [Asanoa sp.]